MKTRYIVIFVVVFILIIAGVFLGRATTSYAAQVVVTEKGSQIGIAPFTDRIDFGDIPQGTGISKTVTLENMGANNNHIRIYRWGGIWSFVKIDPGTSFVLEGGETQDIKMSITIPETATVGDKFTGRIFILQLP
ncbi:MAG: hypothetical protein JW967_09035 [Dehalococcoidales bacterium]|nr:hypothetical protein [Dehalococcoidales bacterium]